MSKKLHKISFVSGKGGVGKTSLAANFAWVCSHFAKTLLVDLDFQNQGATGLFCSYLPAGCKGALDYLFNTKPLEAVALVQLDPNIYFIPAVPLQNPPKHSELFEVCQNADFELKLDAFLNRIQDQHGFEIVVLDCHGGLDTVSLAAHRLSDHTLLIAEADRVTFNGTLELLDFYQAAPCTQAAAAAAAHTQSADAGLPQQALVRPVELVINRIPPKYTWEDLTSVFEKVLTTYKQDLNIADKILAYIPSEELVAETFGELPFLVKVAPNSTMSLKLHLVAYKLFSSAFEFPATYKPLGRLKSERRRRKIDQTLASAESRNIKAIIMTFAVTSNGYVLVFLATAFYSIWNSFRKSEPSELEYFIIGVGSILYFLLISIFLLRAAFGLMRYYRDKYQVFRNSLRMLHSGPAFWTKIAALRLFFLRIATTLLPYVVIVSLVVVPIFMLGMLIAIGKQAPASKPASSPAIHTR